MKFEFLLIYVYTKFAVSRSNNHITTQHNQCNAVTCKIHMYVPFSIIMFIDDTVYRYLNKQHDF